MATRLGLAMQTALREEAKERGAELDSDDKEFMALLAGLDSPERIVDSFIEDSWDFPAFIRVVTLGYRSSLITRDQYISLAGIGQLKSREFDT